MLTDASTYAPSSNTQSRSSNLHLKTVLDNLFERVWLFLLYILQSLDFTSKESKTADPTQTKGTPAESVEPNRELQAIDLEAPHKPGQPQYADLCNSMWTALRDNEAEYEPVACVYVESPNSWKQRKDDEALTVNNLEIRGTPWNTLEIRRQGEPNAAAGGPSEPVQQWQSYGSATHKEAAAAEQYPRVSCIEVANMQPLQPGKQSGGLFEVSLKSPRKVELDGSAVTLACPPSEGAMYSRTKDVIEQAKQAMMQRFHSMF